MPVEGRLRDESLPPEHLSPVEGAVARMAEEVGLTMRTRNRRINTRPALAAAEFARDQGRYPEMHGALFRAHWEGDGWLDSVDDLARIGAGCGLDPEALRRALAGGAYLERIDGWRAEATRLGIDAIPAHIFGGRLLVLGAQPAGVFEEALERLGG